MSTITLRPCAQIDLSVKYARDMGEGKIKQYRVGTYSSLLNKEVEPLDLVKAHILKEEQKEPSEVEFVVEYLAQLLPPPAHKNGLQIEDITDALLGKDLAVKKALKNVQSKGMIHQTSYFSRTSRVLNLFSNAANKVIAKINGIINKVNNFLADFQRLTLKDRWDGKGRFIPFLKNVSVRYPTNTMHFVRYLAVAFEGPDYKLAKESLLNDLKILESKGLILGHLAMPSLMALQDTIGSGRQPYVLFCYPVINQTKLEEILGDSAKTSKNILNLISIENEATEGGINYLDGVSFEQRYQIEVVDVASPGALSQDEIRQEVISTFEAAVPAVNDAATHTREAMASGLMAQAEELIKKANKLTKNAQKSKLETKKRPKRKLETKKRSKKKAKNKK